MRARMNKIIDSIEYPTPWTFSFYRISGNSDSIDVIFSSIMKQSKPIEIGNFSYCLGRNGNLYKKHHSKINSKLIELARGNKQNIQKIAIDLQKRIQQK
jgi:hypothetical protein